MAPPAEYAVTTVRAMTAVPKLLSVKPIEFTQSAALKVVFVLSGPWEKERVLTFDPVPAGYLAPDQREKPAPRTDCSALSFASVPVPVYTTEFKGFRLQLTLVTPDVTVPVGHATGWMLLEVTGVS
jgi:hypothetical protein